MSAAKKQDDQPLENAGEIIERFGGIRPMAKKIDVAVTTIQGWKKRDVIPAARRDDVMKAAQRYNVNLAGVDGSAGITGDTGGNASASANENASSMPKESKESKASGDSEASNEATVAATTMTPPNAEKASVTPASAASTTQAKSHARTDKASFAGRTSLYDDPELNEGLLNEIRSIEKAAVQAAVQKSVWLSGLLIFAAGLGAVVLLWPQQKRITENTQQIAQLQGTIKEIPSEQSMFGSLIPKELQSQIDGLRNEARTIQSRVVNISRQAEEVSKIVTDPQAGNIGQRISRLEQKLGEMTNGATAGVAAKLNIQGSLAKMGQMSGQLNLDQWYNRLMSLQNSPQGQALLGDSMGELQQLMGAAGLGGATVGNAGDTANADVAKTSLSADDLAKAKENDGALGTVMQGLSGDDLKAAAMLLALTQFRNAVHRNGDFADDLATMQKMVGGDDPQLNEAIQKLAPHAQDGVLSPRRLKAEFEGLAGDIVVSSLKGDDVSLEEKAKARLNNMLSVEKDGKLITGTDTQAKVARAQKMLDDGDIQGAITELQSLNGPAAETAEPWIQQAQNALLARDVEGQLTGAVVGKLQALKSAAGGAVTGMGSAAQTGIASAGAGSYKAVINKLMSLSPSTMRVFKDDASGFTILAPDPLLQDAAKAAGQ